jgi:parallel beta-helix repeat protein
MSLPMPRCRPFLLVLLLLPGTALAATYRYDATANRIYVEGGGTATLSDIKLALPDAPLERVPAVGFTWLLRANLLLRDGSTLLLHGAIAAGDVDELRLRSDPGGFVSVTADYGNIEIAATRIRSWDAALGDVDTELADGRAFVRARSFLGSDGVARESRMDVTDSEVSYLGTSASEAHGLVWKVYGSKTGTLDKVHVYGDILRSHVHHNYYGIYTYGHRGGTWAGNEVDHNVKYGFDPHDDSDFVTIEDNDVHDNGYHGIIASMRCDHAVIRGNRSYANAGSGIVLHRSSDDGLIEDNESYGNRDAGVALVANRRTIVRGNRLHDNGQAGVRLSLGEADSLIESNEMAFGPRYVIYAYRGTDTPEPGDDGRPRRNTLRNNDVHDIAGDPVKLADTAGFVFIGNTFRNVGPTLHFSRAVNTQVSNNDFPAGTRLALKAIAEAPASVAVSEQPAILIQLQDEYSTATVSDPGGAIFDPDESLYTTAAADGSTLALTHEAIATNTTVHTRALTATPASGSVRVLPTLWRLDADRSKTWKIIAPVSNVQVAWKVGDLAPGVPYDLFRGSTLKATLVADDAGYIAFTAAPGNTTGVTYSLKPH